MKKLSDYRNGEALDLLVEILEPCSEVLADKEIIDMLTGKGRRMEGVKLMIKNHKSAVIHILAALDGSDPSEYEFGFFAFPYRMLEVLNDEELLSFFMDAQGQNSENVSGSAMENIEGRAE